MTIGEQWTFIERKEQLETEIVDFEDRGQVEAFLDKPSNKLGQLITGILSADKKSYLITGSKLVGAWQKGNFFRQFGRELSGYIEKGIVKEDYFSNSYSRQSFIELLKFIDEDNFDAIKFNAMKSIFFKGITVKESQEALSYELFQITKKLNSNDLLVLQAVFEISKSEFRNNLVIEDVSKVNSVDEWLRYTSKQLGHELPGLVELSEQPLMDLKLISGRRYSDGSGFDGSSNFRLTSLGTTLCAFILEFEWTL